MMSDIKESLAVVQAVSEQLQLPMLETLQYIRANTHEFNLMELGAYFKVMADFEKMFEPV